MIKNAQKHSQTLLDLNERWKTVAHRIGGEPTQAGLAKHLGRTPVEYSRWLNGLSPSPDFRDPENLKMYRAIASILAKRVDDVILEFIPLEDSDTKLGKAFWGGFNNRKHEVESLPKRAKGELSAASKGKLELIAINVANGEEYLDVLVANLRTFVESVKKERWKRSG